MGASRPSKKKKKKTSIISTTIPSSSEPIPLLNHGGIPLLQTEVLPGQAKKAPLPTTTFGPRLKELESHLDVLLFESSHPVVETFDLCGRGQGARGIRIISHWKGGEEVFSLKKLP